MCTKPIKNLSKEIKSDNYCYCKVGRAIAICRVKQLKKSNIAIAIFENQQFDSVPKII